MKVKEVYKNIEGRRQVEKPQNIYNEIWKIDKQVLDDIYSSASEEIKELDEYIYGKSDDLEVLLPKKYEDIYFYGVCAKIDFEYQDTESYANNMAMYNNIFRDMACEFRRKHRQKSDYRIKW